MQHVGWPQAEAAKGSHGKAGSLDTRLFHPELVRIAPGLFHTMGASLVKTALLAGGTAMLPCRLPAPPFSGSPILMPPLPIPPCLLPPLPLLLPPPCLGGGSTCVPCLSPPVALVFLVLWLSLLSASVAFLPVQKAQP